MSSHLASNLVLCIQPDRCRSNLLVRFCIQASQAAYLVSLYTVSILTASLVSVAVFKVRTNITEQFYKPTNDIKQVIGKT